LRIVQAAFGPNFLRNESENFCFLTLDAIPLQEMSQGTKLIYAGGVQKVGHLGFTTVPAQESFLLHKLRRGRKNGSKKEGSGSQSCTLFIRQTKARQRQSPFSGCGVL
jgi:hypothetical protein